VLACLALAAGLVFAALVFANAWTRIAKSQVVNDTGSLDKTIIATVTTTFAMK
jgi:uncharacterized protein